MKCCRVSKVSLYAVDSFTTSQDITMAMYNNNYDSKHKVSLSGLKIKSVHQKKSVSNGTMYPAHKWNRGHRSGDNVSTSKLLVHVIVALRKNVI